MVVFVDLDDSFSDGSAFLEKPFPVVDPIASEPAELPTSPISPNETTEEIQNPNRNGFSAALSCYPYVLVCLQSENDLQIQLTVMP